MGEKHAYEVTEFTVEAGNLEVGTILVADKHCPEEDEPERVWEFASMETGEPTGYIVAKHLGPHEPEPSTPPRPFGCFGDGGSVTPLMLFKEMLDEAGIEHSERPSTERPWVTILTLVELEGPESLFYFQGGCMIDHEVSA